MPLTLTSGAACVASEVSRSLLSTRRDWKMVNVILLTFNKDARFRVEAVGDASVDNVIFDCVPE